MGGAATPLHPNQQHRAPRLESTLAEGCLCAKRDRFLEDGRNLIHLGVGLIMIAVASLHFPVYVSVPLACAGAWFIAWNLFGARLRPLFMGGEWGRKLVGAMDRLAELTAGHDEFHAERRALVENQWPTLSPQEKQYLKNVLLHGRQDATANHAADSLRTKGLIIDGQYGLPATIAPNFRSIIAAKFQDQAAPESS